MEEDGLSVDNLFSQFVFRQDERDMVLKAIRTVKPDYQPSPNLTTSQCTSPLVQDYYAQVFDRYLIGLLTWKLVNKYLIRTVPIKIFSYYSSVD